MTDRSHQPLIDALAEVISEPEEARAVALRAGFPREDLPVFKTARLFWEHVVKASIDGKTDSGVGALAEEATKLYPHNEVFAGHRSEAEGGTSSRTPPDGRPTEGSLVLRKAAAGLGVPGLALAVYVATIKTIWTPDQPIAIGLGIVVATTLLTTIVLLGSRRQVSANSLVTIGPSSQVGGSVAGRDIGPGIQKKNLSVADKSASGVSVGRGVVIQGSVAGRDIVVNTIDTKEIIGILEFRAKAALEALDRIDDDRIEKMSVRFKELHAQHIEALHAGKLAVAHEISKEIGSLQAELNDAIKVKNTTPSPITLSELPGVNLHVQLQRFSPASRSGEREVIVRLAAARVAKEYLSLFVPGSISNPTDFYRRLQEKALQEKKHPRHP